MSDREGDNPGHVTQELCMAYWQTMEENFNTVEEKIDSLRNLFIEQYSSPPASSASSCTSSP